jgi:hypothetical protein
MIVHPDQKKALERYYNRWDVRLRDWWRHRQERRHMRLVGELSFSAEPKHGRIVGLGKDDA